MGGEGIQISPHTRSERAAGPNATNSKLRGALPAPQRAPDIGKHQGVGEAKRYGERGAVGPPHPSFPPRGLGACRARAQLSTQ